MKKRPCVRAGPDKAQMLAEIDEVLDKIDRAFRRCEESGQPGLVELRQARECALHLRQKVQDTPCSGVDWVEIMCSLAVIVNYLVELYSLLSFVLIVLGTYARWQNTQDAPPGRRLLAA